MVVEIFVSHGLLNVDLLGNVNLLVAVAVISIGRELSKSRGVLRVESGSNIGLVSVGPVLISNRLEGVNLLRLMDLILGGGLSILLLLLIE